MDGFLKKADNNDYVYNKQDVYDNLAEIATGIFLNIDNNLLTACQKAVKNKVIEVCGSLSECTAFEDDTTIGTDSLISYKDTNGDTVIDGLMNLGLLKIKTDNSGLNIGSYTVVWNNGIVTPLSQMQNRSDTLQRIFTSINTVDNKIKQRIDVLRTDPTIKTCVEGRGDKWKGGTTDTGNGGFPHLLDSYNIMIFNSALDKATENYNAKYDELVTDALRKQSDDEKAMICTMMAYDKDSVTCKTENDQTVCETVEPIGNLFDGLYNDKASGLINNGTAYVIKNADLEKKLELMSHNSSQVVILNKYGSMISLVSKQSFYSGGICTITTTTTECKNEKEIVHLEEADYVKDKKYEDGTTKKYVCDDCKEKFDGVMCAEYSDPVEKVIEIQM